jgi:hypothetical protein
MGYRSEVGYIIMFSEQEVYNQFKVQYKLDDAYKHCREDEENTNEYASTLRFNDEKCMVTFKAIDVKWYDSFPDVRCHHALLKLAEEYYDKYNCVEWAFVRIGEEVDDIETNYGGTGEAQSYIYPVSSIQWDV